MKKDETGILILETQIANSDRLMERIMRDFATNATSKELDEVHREAIAIGEALCAVVVNKYTNLPLLAALTAMYTAQLNQFLEALKHGPVGHTSSVN